MDTLPTATVTPKTSPFKALANVFVGIVNDAKMIYEDPALGSFLEIFFCYPGFWALFFYRICHAMWYFKIPLLPRVIMGFVRFWTAVDIHPAAEISEGGVLFDHATGTVIGATAGIGARTTIYHQVTLGASGKPVPKGQRRHPIVGANCMIGCGAKVLGAIRVGDNCKVGANSVVTKALPDGAMACGIPAVIIPKKPKPVAAAPSTSPPPITAAKPDLDELPPLDPEKTPEGPEEEPYQRDLVSNSIMALHTRISALEDRSQKRKKGLFGFGAQPSSAGKLDTTAEDDGSENEEDFDGRKRTESAEEHWRALRGAVRCASAVRVLTNCPRAACLELLLESVALNERAAAAEATAAVAQAVEGAGGGGSELKKEN